MISRLFLTIAALLSIFSSFAQTDYERLEEKARRFFGYQEWASANAMYLLMLEEKPRIVSTYAHAAVANVLAGDTIQALGLVPRSMNNEIPIDSLLTEIRTISFSVGRGDLYENYLLGLKNNYHWLSRIADNYLMDYYAFRQNGPELIKYAETMLAGLPDNRNFLRMLAYGRLLDGNTPGALDVWHKVVELYPEDYDTLLDLANCYDAMQNVANALMWFRKADEIKSSPYVTERITVLTRETNAKER